ncbi:MAG: ERCC4 domain-containing protein [Methanothrix sp.]
MNRVRIIVDQRERNIELLDSLCELGIDASLDTLDIGDYLISDRLCIERKTIPDFEKSIIDGRLFDQIERMKKAYELPVIVLEGDASEFRLKHNVINGSIISIYIRYGIPVITSNSPQDTASIILTMAKQEQNGIREPTKKNGRRAFSNTEYMENVVANMPGIGPILSRKLLSHFGSIEAIAHADIKELCKVDKIGKKKALRIKEILNGDYF